MRRPLLALLLLAACHAPPAAPTEPDPILARFDVYGSHALSRDLVIGKLGGPIATFMHAAETQDHDAMTSSQQAIVDGVKEMTPLAYAELSAITYFDPPGTYVTLDLVDEADRAARMTFAPAPTATLADPDGLVALYSEYEDKMWPVIQAHGGKTDTDCPAWHCLTFDDPTLTPYRDAFVARVPAQEDALAKVLAEDSDERARANAAFLIAFLADGNRVITLELSAFRDPSALVRNNAMRVIAVIAGNHPELGIPLDPVFAALRGPSTLDRNKAAAILGGLAKRADPTLRAAILDGAGDVLVNMLALTQPNNHDWAFQILTDCSGQTISEHDVEGWRQWLASRQTR